MQQFVVYYRVSTQKQGASGLGLEAQESLVRSYLQRVEGEAVGTFTEVESGKRTDRTELRKALAAARKFKATLLVAKLDRLARNVAFVSQLMDTPGVEFKAADFPEANRFMVHILAAVAEYERQLISDRTRAAMAELKERGCYSARLKRVVRIGTPENLKGTSPAPAMNRERARMEAERMRPIIAALEAGGIESVSAMVRALNERGYTTERGGVWHETQLRRVLSRLRPQEASVA